ncbi:dipeptide ABC transporter ATP-binding protein [Actinomyces bowdenii]|uniref:ABC transporter ATP-binding protein n=1 Tax=Actinomyces bowdenii TaxID=131109 RepID=A0A853EMX3_9ACTO|nr:ABC transporter ATP-binding protein [Actinomyces bowdenii]MBF0698103.1 ABC transporter ATP-binding protein [Actinomyces bowdenii]NYS70275.1 ABC transporter ATP-binding protein [Actinomyces bowdenii]
MTGAQESGAHEVGPQGPDAQETGGVLRLRGLGVAFAGAADPASAGIDLDLRAGTVLALVGESGSGKSVTALGALGLLPPTARVTGSARLDGVELVGAPRRVLDDVRGRLVGTIFQEPTTALNPLETIAFQIGEAVRAHPGEGSQARRHRDSGDSGEPGGSGESRGARGPLRGWKRHGGVRVRDRVLELLERVGLGGGEDLERIADSYPHQLSGGQLQRACIALALACQPPVLIADEPTTALDVTVQAGILDLLRSLTEEGLAVLLITHDMAVVADIADEVAVMRAGHIVERGPVAQIFSRPQHPYTRQLLAAVPRLDSLRQEDPFEAAACARSAAPADGGVRGGGPDGAMAGAHDGADAGEPVVAIRDLEVVYGGGRRPVRAVQGVTLSIAPGEVLGMVGESGSGKSTIAGTLTGLVPISSGSVRVCGVEIAGARRRDLLPVRRATGVVYQNPASSLNPRRTVGASIAEPLVVHGQVDAAARQARVRELLEAVQLPAAMAQRYPHEMSGGQRQRVAIARALALEPRLVIADEPTSALDVSVQAVVLDLLGSLQAELGFACLFVSHDLAVVDSIATRTVVLSGGRLVEEGPTRHVLADPQQDYTRRLVAAVPVPDPALQAARRRRRQGSRAA